MRSKKQMHQTTLKQDGMGRSALPLSRELAGAAAQSRRFLKRRSRTEIARFILRQQMPDGGFKGRGANSDLYYSVFATAGLKALGWPAPALRLWTYIRAFGAGEDLDPVHRCCLIRLRSAFPMSGKTRDRLSNALQAQSVGSAYRLFLNRLAAEALKRPTVAGPPAVSRTDPTPVLAAAGAMSLGPDDAAVKALFSRVAASGGFCATEQTPSADLLSTAVALFALQHLGADLNPVRQSCLAFIESLWRDSGGFAGHAADEFADVEYTFYALLGVGCLMR